MENNLDLQKRQLEELTRLLSGYTEELFSAYNQSGVPFNWAVLAKKAGSWPGISPPLQLQQYQAYQATDLDSPSTPAVSVAPSTTTDATNAGYVWTPTIDDYSEGSTPINQQIGSPLRYPALDITTSATCLYTNATVDAATGFITAIEIDADTGGGVPASTSTAWYMLLTTLTATVTGDVPSIVFNNDGWFGPIIFRICGAIPILDGTEYSWGN